MAESQSPAPARPSTVDAESAICTARCDAPERHCKYCFSMAAFERTLWSLGRSVDARSAHVASQSSSASMPCSSARRRTAACTCCCEGNDGRGHWPEGLGYRSCALHPAGQVRGVRERLKPPQSDSSTGSGKRDEFPDWRGFAFAQAIDAPQRHRKPWPRIGPKYRPVRGAGVSASGGSFAAQRNAEVGGLHTGCLARLVEHG